MSVEFRHLKYFVALAEELHFARAAARVGIEQSPLSQAIRDLEARLGILLFHRTTCGTSLTRPGAILLPEARRILSLVDRMKRTARDTRTGRTAHVRIGICTDLYSSEIAFQLMHAAQQHAGVSIEIRDDETHPGQIAALRCGTLDICFAPAQLEDSDIESIEVSREPLVAWLPSDHPLAAERTLDAEKLLRAHARRRSLSAAWTLVASGLGVAMVPASFPLPDGVAAIVRPISGPADAASIWACIRRDEESVVLKSLIESLRFVSLKISQRERTLGPR